MAAQLQLSRMLGACVFIFTWTAAAPQTLTKSVEYSVSCVGAYLTTVESDF